MLALLEAILSPELILGTEAIAVIRGVQPRRSMRMPHSLSRPQMHRFGVADVMLDAFDLVGDRFERTHRLGDVVPS